MASHACSIVGIDVALEAVSLYNVKVSHHGIPHEEKHAMFGDLTAGNSVLGDSKFDIAVNSLSLHLSRDYDWDLDKVEALHFSSSSQ